VFSEITETFVFSYARWRSMTRFVTDLVRGHPPTALAVFFDGAAPEQAARAARYRRALHPARRDILWRDLARHPDALSLFGLGRGAARRGLAVVDRLGRLRVGLDARLALWRELPGYRWRARLLDLSGIAALLERPVTPRRAAALCANSRRSESAAPRLTVRAGVSTSAT
jgi:predicted DCC family thiol-disulfide oxidoreductase YuxK